VVFFVTVIVIAHIVAPSTYSFTNNTVSDLGSQGYSQAWIMRVGLWSFGLVIALSMGRLFMHRTEFMLADAALLLYAAGIFLTGVFSIAPFEPGISYSSSQDSLHSFFATTSGLAISLAIVVSAVVDSGWHRKAFHIFALALVMGLSLCFGLADSGRISVGLGLLQKIMWVFGMKANQRPR
jgi:hypothetical membrane protein